MNTKLTFAGRISHVAIDKACIGKKLGDVVIVKTPDGDQEYEVESIEYITQDNEA